MITRDGAMDELLIRIEAKLGIHAAGDAALDGLADEARQRLQRMLGLRARVTVLPL